MRPGSFDTDHVGPTPGSRVRENAGIRIPERVRRRVRGQSSAEFVLVLPILLALVIGIIELGNMWRTYQITTNVAREGARLAILPTSTQANVTVDIKERLQTSGLDSAAVTIVYNDGSGLCDGPGCTGDSEAVRLDYPYELPLLGGVMRLVCGECGDSYGTVTLSTESVMRNE